MFIRQTVVVVVELVDVVDVVIDVVVAQASAETIGGIEVISGWLAVVVGATEIIVVVDDVVVDGIVNVVVFERSQRKWRSVNFMAFLARPNEGVVREGWRQ